MCAKTRFPNRPQSQLDITLSKDWISVFAGGTRKSERERQRKTKDSMRDLEKAKKTEKKIIKCSEHYVALNRILSL